MRDKMQTRDFYVNKLSFREVSDYADYLILARGDNEIHFFSFTTLDPKENYGQVYIRTNDIERLYNAWTDKGVSIHPNGKLQTKPWGQKEFSLLDPDNNLLTFGQKI